MWLLKIVRVDKPIQIQHLLKLNLILNIIKKMDMKIQIQHLLKLNYILSYSLSNHIGIQIQHLLKLNPAENCIYSKSVDNSNTTLVKVK